MQIKPELLKLLADPQKLSDKAEKFIRSATLSDVDSMLDAFQVDAKQRKQLSNPETFRKYLLQSIQIYRSNEAAMTAGAAEEDAYEEEMQENELYNEEARDA